jgi:long-chain fatty acid transport protein
LGVQHRFVDKWLWSVGAAYEFIDLGKARINQQGGPLQGDLQGEYGTNEAHVCAVNLIWKF